MPPSPQHICVQINYNYLFMKIAILVSKFFQNIHQNMTCFPKKFPGAITNLIHVANE